MNHGPARDPFRERLPGVGRRRHQLLGWLQFAEFDRIVTDLVRCLKPGGLLLLHTTNFRLCDTSIASSLDVVLEAEPAQLAPAVKFGPDNRLIRGELYRQVGFRKR